MGRGAALHGIQFSRLGTVMWYSTTTGTYHVRTNEN